MLNINVNVKTLYLLSLDFRVGMLIVATGSWEQIYYKINKISCTIGERR